MVIHGNILYVTYSTLQKKSVLLARSGKEAIPYKMKEITTNIIKIKSLNDLVYLAVVNFIPSYEEFCRGGDGVVRFFVTVPFSLKSGNER